MHALPAWLLIAILRLCTCKHPGTRHAAIPTLLHPRFCACAPVPSHSPHHLLFNALQLSSPCQVAVTLADRKGDTLAYPKVVGQLPFSDTASTAGMGDNYSVVCGSSEAGDGGGAPVRGGEQDVSGL